MKIIREAMYINGVWDETGTLGRFVPQLATLAVLTLVKKQHFSAALVFKMLWYFIAVQDTICFFCQMALRYISELVVCLRRFQVGICLWDNENNFKGGNPALEIFVSFIQSAFKGQNLLQ